MKIFKIEPYRTCNLYVKKDKPVSIEFSYNVKRAYIYIASNIRPYNSRTRVYNIEPRGNLVALKSDICIKNIYFIHIYGHFKDSFCMKCKNTLKVNQLLFPNKLYISEVSMTCQGCYRTERRKLIVNIKEYEEEEYEKQI